MAAVPVNSVAVGATGLLVTITWDKAAGGTPPWTAPLVDSGALLTIGSRTSISNTAGTAGTDENSCVFTLNGPIYGNQVVTASLAAAKFTDAIPDTTGALVAQAVTNNSTRSSGLLLLI